MFPLIAHAAGLINPLQADTIGQLVVQIAKYFVTLSGAVATIMILYGAWQILISGGDEHEWHEGRQTILYALLGVLIAILAAGLVSLVMNILGGNYSSPASSSFYGTTGDLNTSRPPTSQRGTPFNSRN